MQKLHLVGFTTDQKGLILSARSGARSGSFHLPLDDALSEAVEELRERQAEDEAEVEEVTDAEVARTARVESALPVREIQARLRQGRTVQEVAKVAGVEPAWVERFATPVFAEQAQVVVRVRGMALRRPRLGRSSHGIGDAIRRHLAERGVAFSPEEFASAWTTRQLADGRWAVRFRFRHRGKDQTLRFDLDEATGTVTAADRLSGQLGYVAPPPSARPPAPEQPRSPRPGREGQPTAKRATVTTGFRPEKASVKAVSRPAKERERATQAMRKAAAKGAVDSERAAARKTKEKRQAAVRKERAAKVEEARKARERRAAEKAKASAQRAKAAVAKRSADEKVRRKAAQLAAAQAKRAEAALAAAERAKSGTKRVAVKRAAAKAATAKAATKAGPVRRGQVGKRLVTNGPAKRGPAQRVATTEPDRAPAVAEQRRTDALAAERKRADGRAVFRIGLAEASADRSERPPAPLPGNGMAPARPFGRPRRTRPLRAT